MSITWDKLSKRAYDDGAHLKRAGGGVSSIIGNFDTVNEKAALMLGYKDQCDHPGERVNYHFFLTSIKTKLNKPKGTRADTKGIIMRTEEELNKLRAEYQPAYDEYAANAPAGTVVPFEEAFAEHLAALDAEAGEGTGADTPAPAPAKPKKAKEEKAPKQPAAPKPKGFRPTSDDRKALNAAAGEALAKAKVEGTARLKPADGTYSDFLSGKVLKLDEKGNGSATLDVVTAKDMGAVVGKVDVTVKAGVMTAKGKKA